MKGFVRAIAAGLLLLPLPGRPAAAAPVSLEDSIAAALANNPGLRAAGYRIEAARAAQAEARSLYWPSLVAGAGYSLTDNPTQAFMMALNRRAFDLGDPGVDFNHPGTADHLRMTAGVRYPLWHSGRRTAGAVARLGVAAESHATEAYRNTLVYMVMEGYYRALQARDQVGVQEDSLKSLEESLRAARERLAAGAAIVTDVLNLEVQVARAGEDLIRARHGVQLAVAALNTAIGKDLLTAEALAAPADEVPALPAAAAVLDRHPELLAVGALLGIRREEVRGARSAYAPAVNAFGSLDWDSEVSTDFERSYLVGITAEWELFDGRRRRSALQRAQAQRLAAEAEWQEARSELLLAIRQARISAKEALERLAVARASEESAARALALTREQYDQGAATLADLLTAQSGLTLMQTRRSAAFYDYLTALANHDRAQGLLIRRYQGEQP